MKPYYSHAGITIYHGDCREILPSLKADVVVTDPPYGVNLKRDKPSRMNAVGGRVHGDSEPFDPSHLLAIAVPTILWGANAYASRLPDSTGWIVWDKTHAETCEHSQAELAWTNCVGGIRLHREAYHGFMRRKDGWLHPTQKPVALMRWCIGFTPDGCVLDPYMGSGPVLVAAKGLERRAIGIEIEERYCEIAAKRLAQEVFDFTGEAMMARKETARRP